MALRFPPADMVPDAADESWRDIPRRAPAPMDAQDVALRFPPADMVPDAADESWHDILRLANETLRASAEASGWEKDLARTSAYELIMTSAEVALSRGARRADFALHQGHDRLGFVRGCSLCERGSPAGNAGPSD